MWSEALELWLGNWEGQVYRQPPSGTRTWLRFYDPRGQLAWICSEQEKLKAEQEKQKAEQERLKAKKAQRRSEIAQQLAERERQQREMAEQQLATERQQRESLLAKLQAKGIDLDGL